MDILCFGLNHRHASVDVRERFAFGDHELAESLGAFLKGSEAGGPVTETVILSTCNRVEIYACCTDGEKGLEQIRQQLRNRGGIRELDPRWFYEFRFPQSAAHLFRVAGGLDSMMLGETEIFGQVKKAYAGALKHGASGRYLNKLFQKAFRAGKHVRSATDITRGSVSIGSAAVELAGKIFGELNKHHAMILGAGEISERTARSLMSRGVHSLLVSNRSLDRAQRIAEELSGDAVGFDQWPKHLMDTDILICSTAAPHHVVVPEQIRENMKKRRRPLFIIDLAVPRDVHPAVHELDNVYVYDIDALENIADQASAERRKEVRLADKLLRGHLREFQDWFENQNQNQNQNRRDPATSPEQPHQNAARAENDGKSSNICLQSGA
jgi:glutamyl-tRNA reductase